MFHLLVKGAAAAWEGEDFDMDVERFNTFSCDAANAIDPDDPEALRDLEQWPALIMYELGTTGPNAKVVRHGRLREIARYGQVITFAFEPDPERPYLPREKIVEFERHLDMHRFEQNRMHWAIKAGAIPPALLRSAYSELPPRTPELISREYLEAEELVERRLARYLAAELEALPDSAAKAAALQQAGRAAAGRPQASDDADRRQTIVTLPKGARVVAVVAGLETYRPNAAGQQIEPVEFARADAEAFRQAIETVYADHKPEVTLLLDQEVTYATLRDAVRAQAWGLGEEDLFIFYYAGHGFHDATGNRLTVWDTSIGNIEGTTLSVRDDLLAPLRDSPCQRVLAFVDACASRFQPAGRRVITPLEVRELEELIQAAAYVAVFLSCRPGQQSYPDRGLGHGVWTHYLLRAVNGEADEALAEGRLLTGTSLQDYLVREVPRHVAANPRIPGPQTPEAMFTATSTFAIRHVGEVRQAPLPSQVAAAQAPAPERYAGSSGQLFAERFAQAFPGVRGVQWFDDERDIATRLTRLLHPPLMFQNGAPIWWWADGNMHIESFRQVDGRRYLMDVTELDIARIAAVHGSSYWRHFVYVETNAMPPTGADPRVAAGIEGSVERRGFADEEYGLVDGRRAVSRAEYDDGAAVIDGELQDIRGRAELRVRYLTPYNFLIAANETPINNNHFDERLRELLHGILLGRTGFEALVEEVMRLPRRST